MAPLRYAAKFDPCISLDCAPALQAGAIQGKEWIKFCCVLPSGHPVIPGSSTSLGRASFTRVSCWPPTSTRRTWSTSGCGATSASSSGSRERVLCTRDAFQFCCDISLQGDHSGCAKPPVDIESKAPFKYLGLILKQNFCFDVNGRLGTS